MAREKGSDLSGGEGGNLVRRKDSEFAGREACYLSGGQIGYLSRRQRLNLAGTQRGEVGKTGRECNRRHALRLTNKLVECLISSTSHENGAVTYFFTF